MTTEEEEEGAGFERGKVTEEVIEEVAVLKAIAAGAGEVVPLGGEWTQKKTTKKPPLR